MLAAAEDVNTIQPFKRFAVCAIEQQCSSGSQKELVRLQGLVSSKQVHSVKSIPRQGSPSSGPCAVVASVLFVHVFSLYWHQILL